MKTEATILYNSYDPETRRLYEKAFKEARDQGHVGRMSAKHKQAVLTVAYELQIQLCLTGKWVVIHDCIVWVCKKYPREELYRRLSRGHDWMGGQWIPHWHIDSVKELIQNGGLI